MITDPNREPRYPYVIEKVKVTMTVVRYADIANDISLKESVEEIYGVESVENFASEVIE